MPRKSTSPFIKTILKAFPREDIREIGRDVLGLGRKINKMNHQAIMDELTETDSDFLRAYVGSYVLESLGLEQTAQTLAAQTQARGADEPNKKKAAA